MTNSRTAYKTYGTALALILGLHAGVGAHADAPVRQPGFDAFSYFEFNTSRQTYDLIETDSPFLGHDVQALGTFEVGRITVKQETSAMFRKKVTDSGDICRGDRSRLSEVDQRTAERGCGTRVWAYRSNGQVFLFKADRETVQREDKLSVFPLTGIKWDRSITVRKAQEQLATSHVMRAFSIPQSEIRSRPELRQAGRTHEIYAFCAATPPGEIVSTEARAIAANVGLIIMGATLNPLYIVQLPKNQNAPSTFKVVEKESVSVLLIGNSTFTTEYHLSKVSRN